MMENYTACDSEKRDAQQDVEQDVERLSAFLERHARILVLTGAGMSTASGIPDYRDRDGTRRGKTPLQGVEFRGSALLHKRYWARSMLGWPSMAKTIPNAGHFAVAQLQSAGMIAALVTQNVDGLHRQAGSTEAIELHGNLQRVVCLACGAPYARAAIQAMLERDNPALAGTVVPILPDGDAQFEPDMLAQFSVPACLQCGGMLQPDVVFFGDGVPRSRTEAAELALAQADAMLVIGSSLMVLSGYRFCRAAAEAGKPLAAINRGVTRADHLLAFKSEGAAEVLLPLLAERFTRSPSPAWRQNR